MTLPNFYIAGTQKGGTTSLHHLLASHSEVYFPKFPQELHFFDIQTNFEKGLDWFESYFQSVNNEISAIGQTSPFYMYHPDVPNRIQSITPSAKFIFILRNPVTRAYSHYWNSVRYGFERLSFEMALDAEPARLLHGGEFSLRHHSYMDRGFYQKQIQRYERIFGSGSLLVLTQDELISNPENIRHKCASFLNICSSGYDTHSQTTSIHNPSKLPRSRRLQRIRPWLEKTKFQYAARFIDKVNLQVRKYPPIKATCRKQLQNTFTEEIDALNANYFPTLKLSEMWK